MKALFAVSYNDATGTANRVELAEGETLIGRATNCHIVMNVASVSRQHARLCVSGDRCTLSDAGSTYGTLVNGALLKGETQLKAGDTFQCGAVVFALEQAIPTAQLVTDDHQLLQDSASIMLHIDDLALGAVKESKTSATTAAPVPAPPVPARAAAAPAAATPAAAPSTPPMGTARPIPPGAVGRPAARRKGATGGSSASCGC